MFKVTRALRVEGHHGVQTPSLRPSYETYRSPYGPKYKIGLNFHGINASRVTKFATTAALFGGVAGIAALFFTTEIPRVRTDILENLPIVGTYFHKEIPPEDNPF